MTPVADDRRVAYLTRHRETIRVRERIDGRWQSISLADLESRNYDLFRIHVQRLIERSHPPHRRIAEGEQREDIEW